MHMYNLFNYIYIYIYIFIYLYIYLFIYLCTAGLILALNQQILEGNYIIKMFCLLFQHLGLFRRCESRNICRKCSYCRQIRDQAREE